jgi:uncharacterized protein (DUF427 family)
MLCCIGHFGRKLFLMPAPSQRQPLKPGQESVWDYPRPPRVESVSQRIRIEIAGVVLADSLQAVRVLETSHPPSYYIPYADLDMTRMYRTTRQTFCEFKGAAIYWTVKVGERVEQNCAWEYPQPAKGFESLHEHIAFYASRMDACFVGDEQVIPQQGDFYGGWVTSGIVGPFKGGPGTSGW